MSGPARLAPPFENVGADGVAGSLDAVAPARQLTGRDGRVTLAHGASHAGTHPTSPSR